MQGAWNELYAAVSCDEAWLREVMGPLTEVDPFVRVLWGVWDECLSVRMERRGWLGQQGGGWREREGWEMEMGVWRSDYMVQAPERGEAGGMGEDAMERGMQLKQVEFNTISCAGGVHSQRVSDMHRFNCRNGMYDGLRIGASEEQAGEERQGTGIEPEDLPKNNTLRSITNALVTAVDIYAGNIYVSMPEKEAKYCCVLMVVQPLNINIADERPIEYAVWESDHMTPCFRVEFGEEVLRTTELLPNGELLYTPPWSLEGKKYEVAVVYYRAGHDVHEYSPGGAMGRGEPSISSAGAQCRIRLEASRAIKCPSFLGHIATFKQVQTALARPGQVERFCPDDQEKANLLRSTFVDIFEATDERASGIVKDEQEAEDWIVKPSLEGGGHGIFGKDIPAFFKTLSREERGKYILMRKIMPPPAGGLLMSSRGLHNGGVVSELQVFGTCFWKRQPNGIPRMLKFTDVTPNAGWSLKTKAEHIKEMSVIKGFGCFDSPWLIEDGEFLRLG